MIKLLSSIIGMPKRLKNRFYDAVIERRAESLFMKMLVVHEREQAQRELDEHEERKKLAAAWMPFDPRRLTRGQAEALTFFDDLQIEAINVVAEELRAQLSNRALIADGITRDKAMWTAVGVDILCKTIEEKIKHYGGRKKREEAKKKAEAVIAPKEAKRTVADLHGDLLMQK